MGTRLTILRRHAERYKNDSEFRKKQIEYQKDWLERNREKTRLRDKEWRDELSKFRNHRCKECNKLLNYRTKGEYCRSHKKRV